MQPDSSQDICINSLIFLSVLMYKIFFNHVLILLNDWFLKIYQHIVYDLGLMMEKSDNNNSFSLQSNHNGNISKTATDIK